jgi:multisubunit Na+/H+ antiporter MnhG subunit
VSLPSAATNSRTGVVVLYLVVLAVAGSSGAWALASALGLLAVWVTPLVTAHGKGAAIQRMTAPPPTAVEPVAPAATS